jgi:ABC-type metal ion transport system substrate-binding protein
MKALLFTISFVLITSITFAQDKEEKEVKREKVIDFLDGLTTKKISVIIMPDDFYGRSKKKTQIFQSKIKEKMKAYPYSFEFVNYKDYLLNQDDYRYVLILKEELYRIYSKAGNGYSAIYYLHLTDNKLNKRYLNFVWQSHDTPTRAYKRFVKTINKFIKTRKIVFVNDWEIPG